MIIDDVEVRPIGEGRIEVRAMAGGEPLYVHLPADRFNEEAVGDALTLFVVVPAMLANTTLRLPRDVPVSPRIHDALPGIQRVFRNWNTTLSFVELDASVREPSRAGRGTGLYYAGGVDSSYSLLSHEAEIDTLVAIFGFDFTMSDEDMRISHERHQAFARALGKSFVVVESNHRLFLARHRISRTFAYSAMLGAVALLLGLARCYVATSHSPAYIRPGGANPVLDPRFSNGVTEIVHDDASLSRYEKTAVIARRSDFLDNLRVCWEYPNHNCGECAKCVRTAIALRLLGTEGPFPPLDMRLVAGVTARSEHDYVIELTMEAYRKGDAELLRELRKGLRRQDFGEAVRHLGYALTGRRWRNPFSKRDKASMRLLKHELRPDLDLP